MNQEITVLAEYVLVKQVMKSKERKIILTDLAKEEDKFDFSFEVVQLGEGVTRNIKVGDKPIFAKHMQFHGLKVLEKDSHGMTSLVIVHEGDIIAIDNTPKEEISNEIVASKN